MINWLLEQQLVFSAVVLLLIWIESKGISKLGANTVYALWFLIPMSLIASNLPQDIITISDTSIYKHLVTVNNTVVNAPNLDINWVWLWVLGAASILLLAGLSQWKITQLPTKPALITTQGVELPSTLGVYTSQHLSTPILNGIFKAKILLPSEFNTQFDTRQQQLMLAHELVHYERKDNLYNLLALLILCVFWFNPLTWLAYRAFRRSQELACDATVLKTSTTRDKIIYSKALIKCAEQSLHSFSIHSPYGEKSSMQKRIKNIQNSRSVKPIIIGLTLVLSSSLVAGVALANMTETSHKVAQEYMASPVTRIEPKYPSQAAQDEIEGSVILEFDIAKDGTTDKIKVIESFPNQVFDKASVDALQQWVYKPRVQGGQAQRQTGLKVQLDFRLDNSSERSVTAAKIERLKVQY
ncbi:M56 family metallopeptidase [Paraglaciecola sp. 2405UD69-4]|uniref:M56 family metallopeptidase n=1 Tax=Paraglaciecola sp. 2405UD69-4 TaxID=3391836 RepID=UPI0039C99CAA